MVWGARGRPFPRQRPRRRVEGARFKLGRHVSVGTCRRLLGLMAVASPVLPLGLLHMRVDKRAEITPHYTSHSPYQGVAQLLSTPFTMAGPRFSSERGQNGCDPPSPYDHDGRIYDGLGCGCLPALVLPKFPDDSGHRCIRPPVAECQSVRISANKADSGSPMQSKGEQCPSPSHSPVLALPDLVLGANSPPVSAPLGDLLSQL